MSQTITLKDRHYNITGYVEIKDNGDKVLKDSHYNIVGPGDILTSLL